MKYDDWDREAPDRDDDEADEGAHEDELVEDDEDEIEDEWDEWSDDEDEDEMEEEASEEDIEDLEEDEDWLDGWPQYEGEKRSIIDAIRDWMNGSKGRDEEGTEEQELEDLLQAARDRVEHFYSRGLVDRHEAALEDHRYEGTMEYAIAVNTLKLEEYIAQHDEEYGYRVHPDFIGEEVSMKRIATLHLALGDAEKTCKRLHEKEAEIQSRQAQGELSRPDYDDQMSELSFRRRRAITRLDMGQMGLTYDDLGEVSDQSSHIIQDALSDDDGAARQKIAKKLRSMSRDTALAILDQAVEEGVIDQQVADYLAREYVRAR
jgi:hypothetical protein